MTDDLIEAMAREVLRVCNDIPDFIPVYDREAEAIARAALAVVREREGWQPIETAPDDGTDVLLHIDGRPPVVAGFFRGDWQLFDTGDELPFSASITHWRPLPPSPEVE